VADFSEKRKINFGAKAESSNYLETVREIGFFAQSILTLGIGQG